MYTANCDGSFQVVVANLHGPLGLNVTLSRRQFEALCRPLLLRLVPAILEVIYIYRVNPILYSSRDEEIQR